MKYRKKPVVIEAIQFTPETVFDCLEFIGGKATHLMGSNYITIETLEGDMKADLNDFIIKGISGEFYPCKPDIFEKTYEAVEDQ